MSGINVSQYDVFKIGTSKLKYHNWKLDNYTIDEARQCNEIISLFEGEEFRLIGKIKQQNLKDIDFSKEILMVVIDSPGDFKKAMRKNGIEINGIRYKRFLGTTGGLKNNTLLFVNQETLPFLKQRCNCGRNEIPIVPAKLEAYTALTCSASQPIYNPRKIIVVSDCNIKIKADIIHLDDTGNTTEPIMTYKTDYELENDATDGFGLCTVDYMALVGKSLGLNYIPGGVCLRNAWLKGMLYPFSILEFAEKYNNGNTIVTDVWGNEQDLKDCDMVLTESMLKLWKAYDNIDHYVRAYKENGYGFAVTKISPHKLDDQRELNYQYLQSYEFDDNDIKELCEPTVKYLKDACCGDYEATKRFLGINNTVEHSTWQEALYKSEYMLGDRFIIDSVHKMIKKKIDDAKIGKLFVDGNYQICSGDPVLLMQHMLGLPIKGLLKAGEVYSKYWGERDVGEVVIFRSPMTSHNNIRKCRVNYNREAQYWYQYMDTIMILNGFDTMCQALNGCDFDSDLLFSTNNSVLLKRYRPLPAIICIQRNVAKIIPTEEDMMIMEKNAMGNKVGTITNRITAMMEVQSRFPPESEEYKVLDYRIACGQLFQQNEIDKLKGIVAKPMPNSWYSTGACKDDEFLKSICVEKKPYFMIYIYDDYRQRYNQYLKICNKSAKDLFNKSLDTLLSSSDLIPEEKQFLDYYYHKMPFGMGECAMNRICRYIEQQFDSLVIHLKQNSNYNYEIFKTNKRYTTSDWNKILELGKEFSKQIRNYKTAIGLSSEERKILRKQITISYKNEILNICKDPEIRLNLFLDAYYKGKITGQFFWDCVGGDFIKSIEGKINDNI